MVGTREIKRMKLIYISGPISASARYIEYDNCLHARQWAQMVMEIGAAVHCPHLVYLCGLIDILEWEDFLAMDIEIIRRCDAVLMIGPWQGSKGCVEEYNAAQKFGIPIFTTLSQVRDFVEGD